jgi:hypothetical protein
MDIVMLLSLYGMAGTPSSSMTQLRKGYSMISSIYYLLGSRQTQATLKLFLMITQIHIETGMTLLSSSEYV